MAFALTPAVVGYPATMPEAVDVTCIDFVGDPSVLSVTRGVGEESHVITVRRHAGCLAFLTDAFTDANGTQLTAHTPDLMPSGVSWHNGPSGSHMAITGNELASTSSGGFASAYNAGETAIGLTLPYKVTFVAKNTDHGGNGTHVRLDGPFDVLEDTTSRIDIEIVPLGGGSDSVHVHVIANFDTTFDETEVAYLVTNDVEHTVVVLFEAHQFTVTIDSVAQAPVPMSVICPSDAAYVNLATSDTTSLINLLAICRVT